MIDLRHHVVSLVAVLVALAAGITLGAGPLRDPVGTVATTEDLHERADTAVAERDLARAAVAALDRGTADLAREVATGALEGTTVLLVALPGAPASQVARLTDTVDEAGGEVSGTLRLAGAWAAPERAATRASAAARLEPLLPATPVARTDAALLGAGIGTALLVAPQDQAPVSPGTVSTLLQVLTGGDAAVLEADRAVPPAADVALVVAGPPGGQDAAGAAGTWVDVLAGLAARGPVVVAEDVVPVAGTGAPPEAGSVVVLLRQRAAEDPTGPLGRVSSVDALGADLGRWSTVLAVAEAADGGQGGYGLLDSADGPVPAPG